MKRHIAAMRWCLVLSAMLVAGCSTLRGIVGGRKASSEGSIAKPVEIALGEEYSGGVGSEGTSYYRLAVPFRADIYIEVIGHLGDAELFLFGQDSTFSGWLSASQGSTMNVESYFTPSGTDIFFSVVDYEDEYAVGEQYTIYAYPEYVLDSIGVLIRGEIFQQAQALEPGDSRAFTFGEEALEYFKVTAGEGGTLQVKAEPLPQGAQLGWADANGQYGAVSIESTQEGWMMEIADVGSETICFFYVVGPPAASGRDFALSVSKK